MLIMICIEQPELLTIHSSNKGITMINSKRMPRHKQKHMKNRVRRYSSSKISCDSHSSGGGIHPLVILIGVVIVYVILTN
jgi:hypothetical protein